VGAETVDRVRNKAKPLRGLRVARVNSTYVAEAAQRIAQLLKDAEIARRVLRILELEPKVAHAAYGKDQRPGPDSEGAE
jgi:hypothetical protein